MPKYAHRYSRNLVMLSHARLLLSLAVGDLFLSSIMRDGRQENPVACLFLPEEYLCYHICKMACEVLKVGHGELEDTPSKKLTIVSVPGSATGTPDQRARYGPFIIAVSYSRKYPRTQNFWLGIPRNKVWLWCDETFLARTNPVASLKHNGLHFEAHQPSHLVCTVAKEQLRDVSKATFLL